MSVEYMSPLPQQHSIEQIISQLHPSTVTMIHSQSVSPDRKADGAGHPVPVVGVS